MFGGVDSPRSVRSYDGQMSNLINLSGAIAGGSHLPVATVQPSQAHHHFQSQHFHPHCVAGCSSSVTSNVNGTGLNGDGVTNQAAGSGFRVHPSTSRAICDERNASAYTALVRDVSDSNVLVYASFDMQIVFWKDL